MRVQHQILWRLDYLINLVHRMVREEERQMSALTDLQAEVEKVKTVEASAVTLITQIAQMLRDAIAAGDPAALTDLAAQLDTSATALADAVAANTPAG